MSNTFELERTRFAMNFANYKDKKIVLYGIGRRTATLTEQTMGFHFVGLMDRDQANIGKKMYGLPIFSLKEAEENADMIIINAPVTYWNVIYGRIKNSKIPVFFTNGKRAEIKNDIYDKNNPYWDKSLENFEETLFKYDVITFDMFDTLIVRKVLRPEDVFEIIREKIDEQNIQFPYDYVAVRNQALNNMEDLCYSFDELYWKIQEITGISDEAIVRIKEIELNVEKSLIAPRKVVIDICNKMIKSGKDIYVISDMYFPAYILHKFLFQAGLVIDVKKIIVSSEKGCSKRQGRIWKYFSENILCGRNAIHVGDDIEGDIRMPARFGINTYYIMSVTQMLCNSSIKELYNMVTNIKESLLVGAVVSQLFHNPFALCASRGKVRFFSEQMWGYCIWGPVIFSFVQWLAEQSKIYKISRFVFFARDGYLIQKDYDYYCTLLKNNLPKSDYLYVSRRIAYIAAITDEKSFKEWLEFPYIGKFGDFMESRFSVAISPDNEFFDFQIQMPNDKNKILMWLQPYKENIKDEIAKEREDYIRYLRGKQLEDSFAIVDIGYNGNTQRKLGNILKKTIIGFYFYNDLSAENECNKQNKLIPCFQSSTDLMAEKSFLFKYPLLLESMFTAPYGVIVKVDKCGHKVCSKKEKNQEYFTQRLFINEGIQKFIKDIMNLFNKCGIKNSLGEELFVDYMFGVIFGNSALISEIEDYFYWDDIIVQKRENKIFS